MGRHRKFIQYGAESVQLTDLRPEERNPTARAGASMPTILVADGIADNGSTVDSLAFCVRNFRGWRAAAGHS
jgi:hypothetical protein